jgi:hypothetical protein
MNKLLLKRIFFLTLLGVSLILTSCNASARQIALAPVSNPDWLPYLGANGLYGYSDRQGNLIIQPRFADAYPFINGKAAAQKKSSGKWGLIGPSGEWLVSPQFTGISHGPDSTRANIYSDGFGIPLGGSGFIFPRRLDIVSSKTVEYLIHQDNSIEKLGQAEEKHSRSDLEASFPVPEPVVEAALAHDWQILIGHMSEPDAPIYVYSPRGEDSPRRMGFISAAGEILTPAEFFLPVFYGVFDNFPLLIEQKGRYGYYSPSGHLLVAPTYQDAQDFFVYEFAGVQKNGKWAILDMQGKLRTGFQFKKVRRLNNGGPLYRVELQNGRETIWDAATGKEWAGKVTLHGDRTDMLVITKDSRGKEPLGIIFREQTTPTNESELFKTFCYTIKGKRLNNIIDIHYLPFGQNLWVKDESQKWGMVDQDGNTVIPPAYDEIYTTRPSLGPYPDGVARVQQGAKWFYIDAAGREYRQD